MYKMQVGHLQLFATEENLKFSDDEIRVRSCEMAIQKEDYTRVIYDKGCLRAGEEWVERNLVPVAGVAVAISVLQVPPVL